MLRLQDWKIGTLAILWRASSNEKDSEPRAGVRHKDSTFAEQVTWIGKDTEVASLENRRESETPVVTRNILLPRCAQGLRTF